jgi:hypothetical protein
VTWDEVNREAASDAESVKLREVIENGFPGSRKDLPEELRYFFSMRDDLFVVENVVFKDNKMLIPKKLRPRVVDGLHASHQGVSGMKANAKERLFWPGLDADIKKKRDQCRRCIENAPSQAAEPMILTPPPELPFQQVAVDFYHKGNHNYLIYADRFSGWTEVARMQLTSFKSIQKDLLSWFRTYGVPEEISSDGGPPFRSADYTKFLSTWGITQRLSSAYYPQSNGRAEIAVHIMKRALDGSLDPRTGEVNTEKSARAIMTHRNTPDKETGISPAEMLFGVKLRDHLPDKFRSLRRE